MPHNSSQGPTPSTLIAIASASRRGAETEGAALAVSLRQRGAAATVIALSPATTAERIECDHVSNGKALALDTLRQLRTHATKADLVLAYGSSTLPACAIALVKSQTPFIYRSIGTPGDWVRSRLHQERTGLLYRRAVAAVALWPAAADSISRSFRVDRDHVHVVPNSRDPERFTPADPETQSLARSRHRLPSSTPVIAYVGALAPEKRVDLAIRAVASLSDAHLVIAGDGPLRHELESLATDLRAPVTFLGSVGDITSVYAAADVLMLTSSSEGMPGVLIEAGMCGLPCVTTDVGASSSVVLHGETGEVVEQDADPKALADALTTVLNRRDLYGPAARLHTVTNYSSDRVVDLWIDVIKRYARPLP